MSNRERWTVYPLIFLTLGIAFKDKLVKLVNVDLVACKRLVVTDQKGHAEVIIMSTPAGGFIRTDSPRGSVALGHSDNLAGLMFIDPQGKLVSPSIVVPTGPQRRPPSNPVPERAIARPPSKETSRIPRAHSQRQLAARRHPSPQEGSSDPAAEPSDNLQAHLVVHKSIGNWESFRSRHDRPREKTEAARRLSCLSDSSTSR